jgi:hypothetical protein
MRLNYETRIFELFWEFCKNVDKYRVIEYYMEIEKRIANVDIEINECDDSDNFVIYISGGYITVTKSEWEEITKFISNSMEFIKNN